MPKIEEHRTLPYSAQQIYELVADVAAYPQFLPWTQKARLRNVRETSFEADLVLGFQFVRETFTSRVTLTPGAYRVHAQGVGGGPFSKLVNDWQISPAGEAQCEVRFLVDFEIRNFALRRVIEPLYTQAQRQVIGAFESRAQALYGP